MAHVKLTGPAIDTPNSDGAFSFPTKASPNHRFVHPVTPTEAKGHTLMEIHHKVLQRSPDSCRSSSSLTSTPHDSQLSVRSLEGLDPYDEMVLAARPHLPLAIRTPVITELPARVACHRGDWRNYVENTIEAVESCIAMGADIVEVDVWRTKDGVLVLNHDETLDRTTDLKGNVCDYTYAELENITLKDGLSNMTEFHLATVEQLLCRTKDRVFVNLDKADLYLRDVVDILARTGLVHQVILKSTTSYRKMCKIWGVELMNTVIFMPVFDVKPETTLDEIHELFRGQHDVYEINFQNEEGNEEKLQLIKELAARDDTVIWINTIWATTCGGHSDDRAILKGKDANWGYVISHLGAGILQTDRPELLLEYLRKNDLR